MEFCEVGVNQPAIDALIAKLALPSNLHKKIHEVLALSSIPHLCIGADVSPPADVLSCHARYLQIIYYRLHQAANVYKDNALQRAWS